MSISIRGIQKTTLLDYPGYVAATIFLGGCNFRCPFCHNMNIVEAGDELSEDEVLSFLEKRSGVLEGVCITGGEPTIYCALPDFIKKIKSINKHSGGKFLVKLDTNGTNPEMIKSLYEDGLIDYVAMDIKSSITQYEKTTGINNHELIDNVIKSVNYIKSSGIDYEFRTTVVKQLHTEDVMKDIGALIKDAKRYYLQSFTDSEYVPDHSLEPWDEEKIGEFADIMKDFVNEVRLRGV